MNRPLIALILLMTALLSCSDDSDDSTGSSSAGQPTVAQLYSSSITAITLEVDYASGATPYVGSTPMGKNLWEFFGDNARRMFQAGNKTITYPSSLDQMEELTDITGNSFDSSDILAIADAHRDMISEGSTATFYAVWLDGYYRDSTGVREDVLGVSLGDTGVLAMFKPVIEGGGLPAVTMFVEQTTLIHEFGHATGLVNRGVPLTSAHHDEEHGAHCTNEDCVMYWANEGLNDLVGFVQQFILSGGNTIVFADDCLADMDALQSSN